MRECRLASPGAPPSHRAGLRQGGLRQGWHRCRPPAVYNGLEPWNVATDLGFLIGELDPSAEIYRPQLRYRLVDESAFDAEDLAALNSPVADLFRIEKSDGGSEVRERVHRLRANSGQPKLANRVVPFQRSMTKNLTWEKEEK